MDEKEAKHIKGLYGEVMGLLSQIPLADKMPQVSNTIGSHFNAIVNELNGITDNKYLRFQLTSDDFSEYSNENEYDTVSIRTRIGALAKKLEEEYNFGAELINQTTSPPVIVTVTQNQEVMISVTPIQQLIDSVDNDDLKHELSELKDVLSSNKDPKKTSNILNKIQLASWEIFIKVLPYVLEQLGKR